MFVTFFNNHVLQNQILIIVLEGTLRHKHTKTTQNTLFRLFKTCFSNFYVIFGFIKTKHTKKINKLRKHKLKLKTLDKSLSRLITSIGFG